MFTLPHTAAWRTPLFTPARRLLPFLLASLLTAGPDPALARFSQALTFETIQSKPEEFHRFHRFLREVFPRVHERLECQMVGRASLLYRWPGSQPSLKPVILLAHQDVVEAGDAPWQHPPFAGTIAEDHVWGRGARDFKPGLMAILESAEGLLREGFIPTRDIYLAFGDDEESQGYEGAGRMAALLVAKGVRAECILDEGGGVTRGIVGGIDPTRPVAFVNVAEKGYLSVDVSVTGRGGHSDAPAGNNPVLVLGEALRRIDAAPFPAELREPMPAMLLNLYGEGPLWKRFVFSNLWLTRGAVKRILLGSPDTAAMIRTTVAVTRIEGGVRDNMLPDRASAVLNLRLLPGCTISQAMGHLAKAVNDPRVLLSVRGRASEAPQPSSPTAPAYERLAHVIREVFPSALVVPSLATGATDVRHYAAVSPNLYRFAPSVNTPHYSGNGHKADERLPVEDYRRYVAFYTAFLKAWN